MRGSHPFSFPFSHSLNSDSVGPQFWGGVRQKHSLDLSTQEKFLLSARLGRATTPITWPQTGPSSRETRPRSSPVFRPRREHEDRLLAAAPFPLIETSSPPEPVSTNQHIIIRQGQLVSALELTLELTPNIADAYLVTLWRSQATITL